MLVAMEQTECAPEQEWREPTHYIDFNAKLLRERLNCWCFSLTHNLAGHPLFELPRLIELARETAQRRPECLHYDTGATDVSQRWDATSPSAWPVDETIERIANAEAWIVIRQAHRDPGYKALLGACIRELLDNTDPSLKKLIKAAEAIIFITSPNRLTTYHIDRECNFLFQVRGEKTIHVFDRDDREILTEEEIERFWSVDNNAAVYKPQYQDRAYPYVLRPGNGIHLPINTPHWLRNGNNISVSLNINLRFCDRTAGNLYRANYLLRRMGLTPSVPNESRIRDGIKARLATVVKGTIDATPNAVKDTLKLAFRPGRS